MNPVNATSLYVSASRSVLQCDPRDPRALAELCKLLPFFRQSVSCLVCGECVCVFVYFYVVVLEHTCRDPVFARGSLWSAVLAVGAKLSMMPLSRTVGNIYIASTTGK